MSVYGSVFFLVLILSYAATQSTNLSECGSIEESTLCSSLGGRTSDYITPPNLPPEIQLNIASVGYSDLTLRLLLEQTESPEACYEFAIHQLCLVVAPPCNPNTFAPLLLCPETCLAYDRLISSRLCDSYVDEIIQTLEKSSLDSLRALANRFRVFNCSDPATYFQNRTAEFENSSCTNLFSPNTQESIMSMESLFSCVPVSGSPCQAWFPGTFTSAILVPGRGEKEEDIFITLAKVSPSLDDTCSQWLNFIACNYLHPQCNENGEQVVLCEGECEAIARVFLEGCSIAEILETLNTTEMSYTFLNRQQQVDCSDSDTYLIPTIPVDNSSCLSATHLLSIDENDNTLSDAYIGAIVGGVVLVLLVVLLTVALIVLCTRTRARQKMVEMWMSHDVMGHLTLSQRLSLQLQGIRRTLSSHEHRLERGEVGYKEEQEVLRLPERELKQLQLQFAGSIVQFSNLTMDTENCLGQGAFGKVYSGDMELRGIRTKVAIKTIKRISTEDQLQSFLAESLIMKDFQHPHVLGLLGVCFDTPDNSPYIILPFMANGSVKTFLRAKRVHPTNFDDCPPVSS
ncbi:Hepatocyte growth factor receptor [Geodia barretti]|uniref:Hepatocyte growth factor receptor n=1 Tax=Geodia barretti TaxID=519541 RepID=A0AA35SGN5_GEOBA|nr:Hepatocyte growth factor receptor [Geodia barretti]